MSPIKPKIISVLVVDDSAFMRKALKRMLNSDPLIEVIGDARDGEEAIEKVKQLRPDVITLDVKMSGMDGLQALTRIMTECPTPVLMVSSLTSEGGDITLRALSAGAVDFIDKSSCHTTMDILDIAESLVQKVKVIAGVDLKKIAEIRPSTPGPSPAKGPSVPFEVRSRPAVSARVPSHLVAIGASTGGPMSLEQVFLGLPPNYPGAILVVQHMPVGFTRSLADRMNNICALTVKEAEEGDLIQPNHIYIAPGGYHLKVRKVGGEFHALLSREPKDTMHCPSVDVLFESVAEVWPGRMMGVVMTGMGADGALGSKAIKERGGTIIAQNEETCVVYGMPRAVVLAGCADRAVPLSLIAPEIVRFS